MDLYHDHIQQKVNITAGSIVFLFILEIEQIPQEGGEISDFIWLDIYVLLHFSLFSGFPGVARHSQHNEKNVPTTKQFHNPRKIIRNRDKIDTL